MKPVTCFAAALSPFVLVLHLTSGLARAQERPFAPFAPAADLKTAREPSRARDTLPARPERRGAADLVPAKDSRSIDPRAPLSALPGIDHSRAHYDTPGDGSLWVRGEHYKMSFDTSGATYYPLFGARQSRHYPHALSPDAVTIGGMPLAFDADATAMRAGDRVEIDRGSFVEAYDLTPGSIEQTFVFASLPNRGDLVLHIPIASELESADGSQALEFRSELGHVSYGRAIAVDGAGHRASAATTLADGSITIHVGAEFLEHAALPLVIDPVVSTFTIDTTSFDNYLADVAYDATYDRWLVVYEEHATDGDFDVYYVMLSSTGVQLWSGYINSSTVKWRAPRCANLNSANQFLVVASAGTPGDMAVRGRTVQAGSSALGSDFLIGSDSGWSGVPSVGGDPYPSAPATYCVAYERVYGVGDNDILVRMVGPDNSVSGTIYLSNSGGTLDGSPSVSRGNGGSTWTIAWSRSQGAGSDIWAGRIRYDGLVVNAPFPISTGLIDRRPCASSPLAGSQRTLVVFDRDYGPDNDIQGVLLDGGIVVQSLDISILENVQVFQNQIDPYVDSDGHHFLVGYAELYSTSTTDYDIYVTDLYMSGNTLGAAQVHQNLAFSGQREDMVRLASAQSAAGANRRFMATWHKQTSSTNADVLGALFDGFEGGPDTSVCFGDGSGAACPCGNNGASGHGCASSVNAAGGLCDVTGSNSTLVDTTVLHATGLPSSSVCLFFQGTSLTSPTSFGDGLFCTGGTVIRLATKTAVAGSASYPGTGDSSITVRGGIPLDGGMRVYQVWYRNSAVFCTSATFNLTNGVRIDWAR